MAPLIPPVSEVSMILSRHKMLLFRKFSLVPEYMVKLAAPKIRTFNLDVRKVRTNTRTNKRYGHQRYPQPSIEPHYAFFAINKSGKLRDSYLRFRRL